MRKCKSPLNLCLWNQEEILLTEKWNNNAQAAVAVKHYVLKQTVLDPVIKWCREVFSGLWEATGIRVSLLYFSFLLLYTICVCADDSSARYSPLHFSPAINLEEIWKPSTDLLFHVVRENGACSHLETQIVWKSFKTLLLESPFWKANTLAEFSPDLLGRPAAFSRQLS